MHNVKYGNLKKEITPSIKPMVEGAIIVPRWPQPRTIRPH